MQQIISNLVWTTKQTAKITFGRDKQHWLLLSVSTRYLDHDNTPCSDSSFFQFLLCLHITCSSNVLDRAATSWYFRRARNVCNLLL